MSQKRNVLARDTEHGSGTRHGLVTLVAFQLISRGLVHYGIPVAPDDVLMGTEMLIDGASAVAGAIGYGVGYFWRRYIVRSGADSQSK